MSLLTMVSSAVGRVIMHLALVWRVHAASPALDAQAACAHVIAAEAVAAGPVTPELLLGVAFVESRFDPTAVSRVEGHARGAGSYPSRVAPAQLDARAALYCGPLQAYASSWSRCLELRELRAGYQAGAAELQTWLRDRRIRGDLVRALAGHGCGNHGVVTGACNGYPARVLWMERQFRLGGGRARPPTNLARL